MAELANTALLMPDELPAVEVYRPSASSPLLIHCDHGGNAVPRGLNDLGLSPDVLSRHVGWDIGAAAVARQLAVNLDATAVIARYSRLVIDLNRALGDNDAFPAMSDGIAIPGNAALTQGDLNARADHLFWPYHKALDSELARIKAQQKIPVMFSVHSFTPALMESERSQPRPWHCGVMFSRDRRFGDHLIAALRGVPGMAVGVNEPYSGVTHGYCMKMHGLAQGMPHAQIEIRQDLICSEAGQAWWGGLLSCLIAPILGQSNLAEIRHF
ncbi:MAG: N-formylglutamate amidohydrolase [Alphaproteobacteria bacterium]|nr:N-formylglutamate amidohydrolase [Alphaproteobacteria bacterium]